MEVRAQVPTAFVDHAQVAYDARGENAIELPRRRFAGSPVGKGGAVQLAEQVTRSGVHRVEIQREMMSMVARSNLEGVPAPAGAQSVTVQLARRPQAGVPQATSLVGLRRLLHVGDPQLGRTQRVEATGKRLAAWKVAVSALRKVEMDGLATGVHACIGTARAVHGDLLPRALGERHLEHVCDGTLVGLCLEACERGAVIEHASSIAAQ